MFEALASRWLNQLLAKYFEPPSSEEELDQHDGDDTSTYSSAASIAAGGAADMNNDSSSNTGVGNNSSVRGGGDGSTGRRRNRRRTSTSNASVSSSCSSSQQKQQQQKQQQQRSNKQQKQQQQSAQQQQKTKTSFGIWSGYLLLENLRVKTNILNEVLTSSNGLPFEFVHVSIRTLEITVPWGKWNLLHGTFLGGSGSNGSTSAAADHHHDNNNKKNATGGGSTTTTTTASAVLVIDGLYVLLRQTYEFDDNALRKRSMNERRKTLEDASQDLFSSATTININNTTTTTAKNNNSAAAASDNNGSSDDDDDEDNNNNTPPSHSAKTNTSYTSSSSSSWMMMDSSSTAAFIKDRLKSGLLAILADSVQIHIRDVHIRLEDCISNPGNPFAIGFVLESLHIQQDHDYDQQDHDAAAASSSYWQQQQQTTPTQPQAVTTTSAGSDGNEQRWGSLHRRRRKLTMMASDKTNTTTPPPTRREQDRVIHMISQLNRVGLYVNALSTEDNEQQHGGRGHVVGGGQHHVVPMERRILSSNDLSSKEIEFALDQSIARRGLTTKAMRMMMMMRQQQQQHDTELLLPTTRTSTSPSTSSTTPHPQHTYLLLPLDGMIQATLSTQPKNLNDGPAVHATLSVEQEPVTIQLRDDQCMSIMRLYDCVMEHTHRKKYRIHRPTNTISKDPVSWWRYAVRCTRYELRDAYRIRWSFHRFRERFHSRQTYCNLYERRLMHKMMMITTTGTTADDAAGPGPEYSSSSSSSRRRAVTATTTTGTEVVVAGNSNSSRNVTSTQAISTERNNYVQTNHDGLAPLSEQEELKLQSMEDGTYGDLSIQDILLYRILVHRRIGLTMKKRPAASSSSSSSSWIRRALGRMIGDDQCEEEDYDRLLAYWQEWSEKVEASCGGEGSDDVRYDRSLIAASFVFHVKQTQFCLYAPLGSTADQTPLRRLQYRFLDLTFDDFEAGVSLMGDYATVRANVSLDSFTAKEIRSNRKTSVVMTVADDDDDDMAVRMPLFEFELIKKPPCGNDYDIGIWARVQAVDVLLLPDAEWVNRIQELARPIPHVERAAQFWKELSMAYVNSWTSGRRLGLLTKAEAAVWDHKKIDLDVVVDCPIVSVSDGANTSLVFDLGWASIKTKRLAGVAGTNLLNAEISHPLPHHRPNNEHQHQQHGVFDPGDSNTSQLSSNWRTDHSLGRRSGAGSGFFDESGLDSYPDMSMHGEHMDIPETAKYDSIESFFYDVYELKMEICQVAIKTSNDEEETDEEEQICGSIDIHLALHMSIVPVDPTFPRLKVYCVIEEVDVTLSLSRLLKLGNIIRKWRSAPSQSSGMPMSTSSGATLREKVVPPSTNNDIAIEEESDSESDFDENEFFDAVDNESSASDSISVMLDDNLMAETESVPDSEIRSAFHGMRRRRQARGSVSEVSSLSESSLNWKRVHFQGNAYLSADNLARLEEEAAEDSLSKVDEGGRVGDESFRSAVSPNRLADLVRDLDQDLEKVEAHTRLLRERIADLRRQDQSEGRGGGDGDAIQRRKTKVQLRRQLDRAMAELRALKAARLDIMAEMTKHEGGGGCGDQPGGRVCPSQPTRQAAALISFRKKNMREGQHILPDHSLTRGLKRFLLKGSVVLTKFNLHLRGILGTSASADALPQDMTDSCSITVSRALCAMRRTSNETKFCVSIDSAFASLSGAKEIETILVCGQNLSSSHNLLPSHLPQFVSAASMEEKFLRCVFELRRQSDPKGPLRRTQMRLLVGDIEVSPHRSSIERMHITLDSVSSSLKERFGSEEQDLAVDTPTQTVTLPGGFCDCVIRFSSLRWVLCNDEEVLGAVVATDFGGRLVSACIQRLHKDRCQLDLRCSNLQVLSVEDLDAGRGSELFGKSDIYHPLVRVRLRSQAVPPDENDGWVLGNRSEDTEIRFAALGRNSDTFANGVDWCWNTHVGIKIDSISVNVPPKTIARIEEGIFIPKKEPRPVPDNRPTQTSSLVRWRVDLSLKTSSIFLYGNETQETSLVKSRHLVTFSTLLSLQQSAAPRRGIHMQLSIVGLSLSRTLDSWPIIEPVSVQLDADIMMNSNFVGLLGAGQLGPLRAREGFSPNDTLQLAVNTPIIGKERLADVDAERFKNEEKLILSLSPVKINASVQICAALAETLHALARIRHRDPTNDGSLTKKSTIGWEDSGFRFMRVSFEEVALSLYHEGPGTQFTQAQELTSLVFDGLRATIRRSSPSSEYSISVHDVVLVDMLACGAGLRALGRDESKSCRRDESAFLSVSAETKFGLLHQLNVQFGRVQLLALPSLVRTLLNFERSLRIALRAYPYSKGTSQHSVDTLETTRTLSFSISIELLECLLASKDLTKQARDASAVAFRLRAHTDGSLKLLLLEKGLESLPDQPCAPDSRKMISNVLDECHFRGLIPDKRWKVVATDCHLQIKDFQIHRTAISKQDTIPSSFSVTPPLAGEQRITNSFGFKVTHKVAVMVIPACGSTTDPVTRVSQVLEVKAEFVDLLLYIAQSPEGVTEALRVSIRPIVDMLQEQRNDASSGRADTGWKQSLKDIILGASSVISLQAEGFQVTCVPGGATRLTESPIIKFGLLAISSGGAVIPTQKDFGFLSEASPVAVHHSVAGAWLACRVCASYHNRRLVAWEPFIEPWSLQMQLGADLSRMIEFQPVHDQLPQQHATDSSVQKLALVSRGVVGGRLRDIGRLLRSPFKMDLSAKKEGVVERDSFRNLECDLSYLFLFLAAEEMICSALVPPRGSRPSCDVFSCLPGSTPADFLDSFGLPDQFVSAYGKGLPAAPAIVCEISDSETLNINLSGALIENISDYIGGKDPGATRRLAPHWIRNNSGLTLRFHEILDKERIQRGEKGPKFTLPNDTELPLSLKRSLSQSCDPHKAYISLELGSFEDTVGRVNSQSRGSRSSTFSYRVSAKVPVDTVGIHRYPLDYVRGSADRSHGDRAQGYIIVRVALQGGIKMVVVESPMLIKNVADIDLLCEIREHDGLSLLWRCIVPRLQMGRGGGSVSIPADIVPFVHGKSYFFSVISLPRESSVEHESDVQSTERNSVTRIAPPRPYSQSSYIRGLVSETNIATHVLETRSERSVVRSGLAHLNLCAIRIGGYLPEPRAARATSRQVPEQRMLLFRPPLVIRNHLAVPVQAQLRDFSRRQISAVGSGSEQVDGLVSDWQDLGTLKCGGDCCWTRSLSSENVEFRIRLCAPDGSNARQFPEWSLPIVIPSEAVGNEQEKNRQQDSSEMLPKLRVVDSSDVPLLVSVNMSRGGSVPNLSHDCESVRTFSDSLPFGSRVVRLFTPFWIVDGSGLDLQYKLRGFIAGQDTAVRVESIDHPAAKCSPKGSSTLGLAELLDDKDMGSLPSQISFRVLMIGDEGTARLHVRRRWKRHPAARDCWSPWSDAIPLTMDEASIHDTSVLPPLVEGGSPENFDGCYSFSVRSRLVRAPDVLGGSLGTRLVHIVCKYAVVNELGCQIEIREVSRGSPPIIMNADERPQPLHLDDAVAIKFRPREFGWLWSGRFKVKHNRKDVTLRMKHNLKGRTMIVNVEFHSMYDSGTCIVAFRQATHAPYRIENHTMYPLEYEQTVSMFQFGGREEDTMNDSVILPYHNADFAWKEPEQGDRSVCLRVADFGNLKNQLHQNYLGRFSLDSIAPGTHLVFSSRHLSGQVVADGPTRVLQVSEVSAPHMPTREGAEKADFQKAKTATLSSSVKVQLSHGVGVSVVDWKPQELLYLRFEELLFCRRQDGFQENVSAKIGSFVANNQLWFTPYPVLLRVGALSTSRRSRRHDALSVSLSRSSSALFGHGDLSLFDRVDVSFEPSIISVDGNLAASAIGMMRHIKEVRRTVGKHVHGVPTKSRNQVLRDVLNITEENPSGHFRAAKERKYTLADDFYSAVDQMATSAIAAKLRYECRPCGMPVSTGDREDEAASSSLFNSRYKYYIERLKISAAKAEISWSGPLPISTSLPRFMRPALTFENLPLFVRPYSNSHVYGTAAEHFQSMRSHYFSIWRIFDLIGGVVTNPSFLLRSCVFTWRESVATLFESVAGGTKSMAAVLETSTRRDRAARDSFWGISWLTLFDPLLRFEISLLGYMSSLSGSGAALFRYNATRHRASAGLVRSRNPRLFANVDGKDLLVEYVAGENAGKALLSRVRKGVHMGEGYVYHVEKVRLPSSPATNHRGSKAANLIVMVTFDRIILLNGQLNERFCEVVWEVPFTSVVQVEAGRVFDDTHDTLLLWYFSDSISREERTTKSVCGDSAGLGTLRVKPFFVLRSLVQVLLGKIKSIDGDLVLPSLD